MNDPARLQSWKEIASYLGCDISTAQRWERERGLPVRRVPGGKRQSVFALGIELDEWRSQQSSADLSESRTPSKRTPSPRLYAVVATLVVIALFAALIFKRPKVRAASHPSPDLTSVQRIPVTAANWIEHGDLNHDGIPDIVVSGYPTDIVTVILSDGRGGASSAQGFAVCDNTLGSAIADFDGDGNMDLAIGCSLKKLFIYWGDGTGNFPQHSQVDLPVTSARIAAGDLDGDGRPDLVVAGRDGAMALLARKRSFLHGPVQPVETLPGVILIHDLDGDGRNEILIPAVGDGSGRSLDRYRFDRSSQALVKTGRLSTQKSLSGRPAIADFNEDGWPDLAIGTDDAVELFFGNPQQKLERARTILESSISGRYIATADFNGDGHADLLVSDRFTNSVHLLYGDGHGNFSPGPELMLGTLTGMVTVADFNSDGRPDFAVVLQFDHSIAIALNPFRH